MTNENSYTSPCIRRPNQTEHSHGNQNVNRPSIQFSDFGFWFSDFTLLPKAALSLAMFLLAITTLFAQEPITLHDFTWTVNTIRSEPSIQREKAGCHLLTGGAVEKYKPTNKTLSIATVTLNPEKSGELILIPELFLTFDGDFYSLCEGVRVIAPKPSPASGAFLPPSGGLRWPGQGARIRVTQDESLVLELALPFRLREGMQILATTPAISVPSP